MPLSKAKMRARKRQDRDNVKPKSNLNDTYKAPQPAWMLPGADVKQVKPAMPAWLKKS